MRATKAGRVCAALTATVITVGLLLSGCSKQDECQLKEDLTSSCGVLWGITTQEPTLAALSSAEQFAARTYDLVYRFHDLDDQIPTDEERQIVKSGRALHLSIDVRDNGNRDGLSWRQVADGDHDSTLRAQAEGVASLQSPVFVTFEHEMDQPNKTSLGTAADFIAAWRHVHEVYQRAGADNAVWVWVAMGTEPALPRAGSMWPGNDVVDWISWDVYNASGCRVGAVTPDRYISFEDSMLIFYTWLQKQGKGLGIDTTKPIMLSEVGSVVYPDDPETTAAWYAAIPHTLRDYPQIKAVGLWDHSGNGACDYRFTGIDAMQQTMRDLGETPELAPVRLGDEP